MASVNLETLKSSGLEKRIRSSIFSRNYRVVDSYISDNLKKKGDNFFIPTIQTILEGNPELEKELIDLYNRKFPMGDTDDIDYEIKLLQASALDGLVVGINTEKDGDFQIYTANIGAIFGVNNESKFNLDRTLELNRKRIVHAVRIDIEYTSEEGFNYKVVSLNKNTNLHIVDVETFEGRFHLVPYIAIQRSMAFFKEMLDDMRVLSVTQDKGEVNKTRYITNNGNILSNYSDSEEFAKSLKASYFPLKGFFYAPVIGASSITSGVTRIDLLDVSNVGNVGKNNLPKIAKPKDGLEYSIKESCMLSVLNDMYNRDIDSYQKLIDSLPNNDILTGAVFDIDKGVPNPLSVIKYTNGISRGDLEKVHSLVPGLEEEYNTKKGIFNKHEKIDPSSLSIDEVRGMLKNGVYKFQIRKKDCNYSTITVTNSVPVLKALYGDDYFAKYESFGTRVRKLESYMEKNLYNEDVSLIENWLHECGFPVTEDNIDKIEMLWGARVTGNALHEELLDLFNSKPKTSSRKSTRRSASNEDLILARVCFASTTTPGSVDFYRYLDMSKVVSIYRIG